jgi:hypothetical protein
MPKLLLRYIITGTCVFTSNKYLRTTLKNTCVFTFNRKSDLCEFLGCSSSSLETCKSIEREAQQEALVPFTLMDEQHGWETPCSCRFWVVTLYVLTSIFTQWWICVNKRFFTQFAFKQTVDGYCSCIWVF